MANARLFMQRYWILSMKFHKRQSNLRGLSQKLVDTRWFRLIFNIYIVPVMLYINWKISQH